MTTGSFITDTYENIKKVIINLDEGQVSDIYVISFYKSNIDDDPRRPTLTVGYNTLSRWRACTPVRGQEIRWLIASDEPEAKWNYAFWLQNEELVIGENDYDPVSPWVKQLPYYYTDEQEREDFDSTFELGEQIQEQFVGIMIAHAKKLHEEGIIAAKFGVDIPVIVHELEYFDEPLSWTKQANPAGQAKDFEDWVNSL